MATTPFKIKMCSDCVSRYGCPLALSTLLEMMDIISGVGIGGSGVSMDSAALMAMDSVVNNKLNSKDCKVSTLCFKCIDAVGTDVDGNGNTKLSIRLSDKFLQPAHRFLISERKKVEDEKRKPI